MAKLLVIILRDFAKESFGLDKNKQDLLAQKALDLSTSNLVYLQPFYQERVLFAAEEQRQ